MQSISTNEMEEKFWMIGGLLLWIKILLRNLLKMKVFKFGGASVKNSESIRNILNIISSYNTSDLIVVVSAMDKTTNALEEVVKM